jgi:hypothetical protein
MQRHARIDEPIDANRSTHPFLQMQLLPHPICQRTKGWTEPAWVQTPFQKKNLLVGLVFVSVCERDFNPLWERWPRIPYKVRGIGEAARACFGKIRDLCLPKGRSSVYLQESGYESAHGYE